MQNDHQDGTPRLQRDHVLRPGRVPRLISRLYRGAGPAARASMLTALLRPFSPLAMAAVASGAFAGLVARRRTSMVDVALDEAGRYTADQVLELARFAEQIDIDACGEALGILAASPGVTAFGVAAAVLWLRWHGGTAARRPG